MNIVQHLFQSSAELYMPTKKRRVGFIPNYDVLALINKLSYENNLSNSKIINILVEEALNRRGMLKKLNVRKFDLNFNSISQENLDFENNDLKYKLKDKNPIFNEFNEEPFDDEMYAKFLIFLEFKERMKKEIK